MNILIIQGPNLNLIGVKSAKLGKRVTLDKINKEIRRYIRKKDIKVKIYQTHNITQAVTLLQRNRNWADGIIIAPGVWSTYEAILLDTLQIIGVTTIEVYDENDDQDNSNKSLLSTVCINNIVAPAEEMFVRGLKHIIRN
ncbi:MAG: type II 3-dehydroquinate dehydratase [Candidatus Neomarinimicrobiota bacterium]